MIGTVPAQHLCVGIILLDVGRGPCLAVWVYAERRSRLGTYFEAAHEEEEGA